MKLLLITLTLIFLSGCLNNDSDDAPLAGTGTESNQTKKEEIEKWNLYVDLGNYLAGDFSPAMDEYFNKFGSSVEYRPGEQDQYMADFLSRLVDDNQLSREIELALAKAAHLDGDLDLATQEVGVHLREVWTELIKARDYYATGKFESDDYAEAKEVHARIYDAYMSLSATNTRFLDILTKEDAERRKRDIQEMRDQGLSLRPAMLGIIDKGQALQDLLNQLSITSGSLSSFNPEVFIPLYEDFNKSINNFESILSEMGTKNKEGIKDGSLNDFKERVKAAKTSAADLIELRQLKGKLDDTPENTPGTPEHFGKELGFLVDTYNSLVPTK